MSSPEVISATTRMEGALEYPNERPSSLELLLKVIAVTLYICPGLLYAVNSGEDTKETLEFAVSLEVLTPTTFGPYQW